MSTPSKRRQLKELYIELASYATFEDDLVKEQVHSHLCTVIDSMPDEQLDGMISIVEALVKTVQKPK